MRGTIVAIEPGPDRDDWVELLAVADEEAPLLLDLQHGVLYGVVDTEPAAAKARCWWSTAATAQQSCVR